MVEEFSLNSREIILDMLLEVEAKNSFSHIIIKDVLDKYDYLEAYEKKFIKRIFEGVIERKIELDYIISKYAKVKGNKLKPALREILRMGIYQILYMDSVPDSAVCNEAVKLVKLKKYYQLTGFVNGVLRNVARDKDNIKYPTKNNNESMYLSVKYSMPEWIVTQWLSIYSFEVTEKMLIALLEEHNIVVRVNENISDCRLKEVINEWEDKSIIYNAHPYYKYAYELSNVEGMNKLEGFREGLYTVQDISSMLVAIVAGIKGDEKVIDICAAPGGKACHIATRLKEGSIIACDITQQKVDKINENIERLKLHNIEARVSDATVNNSEWEEQFDILIADVPCSGLGVIGKKRDIKYNASIDKINELVDLQKNIFNNAKKYVKKNGYLIYSTCTISKKENEEMVEWICRSGEFALENIESYLPKELHGKTSEACYLQLLPGVHKSDGFFIARMKKIK